MRIIITGTPGTGKTSIARRLAKALKVPLISITDVVDKEVLREKGDEVDLHRLMVALEPLVLQSRDYVLEGHLACEIKLPSDQVIVLRSPPNVLRRRLSKRDYPPSKLEENIMAEVLDYCTQRVMAVYGKRPLEIDTSTRTMLGCVADICCAVRQKKKKIDDVSYPLENYLGLG